MRWQILPSGHTFTVSLDRSNVCRRHAQHPVTASTDPTRVRCENRAGLRWHRPEAACISRSLDRLSLVKPQGLPPRQQQSTHINHSRSTAMFARFASDALLGNLLCAGIAPSPLRHAAVINPLLKFPSSLPDQSAYGKYPAIRWIFLFTPLPDTDMSDGHRATNGAGGHDDKRQ